MTHKKQILDFPTIICSGYTCVLHIHSAIEECTFFALKGLIDKKTRKATGVRHLQFGQTIRLPAISRESESAVASAIHLFFHAGSASDR